MTLLTHTQRAYVAQHLTRARAHYKDGDLASAMSAAEAAHPLAMNHPVDHARVHWRMLRVEARRLRPNATRFQIIQLTLSPVSSVVRVARGLEPGQPGGTSILRTLLGRYPRQSADTP